MCDVFAVARDTDVCEVRIRVERNDDEDEDDSDAATGHVREGHKLQMIRDMNCTA